MDLPDLLWAKAEPNYYGTREEFLAPLGTIEPVYLDGELAWITTQNGPEFHFHSVGRTRPMPRRMIKAFLQKIIDQHGYALTKTPKEDERQQCFNHMFGFEVVGEDEFDILFRIERLPHV